MKFILKKLISNNSSKQVTYLFSPKLTSFVSRNRGSIRVHHTSLSNRTNNIIDSNADVAQLKVFLDPLLEGLLKEEIFLRSKIF
jgi:hypothetical protein